MRGLPLVVSAGWLALAVPLDSVDGRVEAAGRRAARMTAFVDVTVVPMDRERLLTHQTVVVRGAEIVALGAAGSVVPPPGALRIDGRGRFLLPGLADMHTHVQSEHELALLVAHGVTTIRDMFGAPYKLVWRRRIARGELFGPTLYAAGPIVDGTPPDMTEMTAVASPEDARRAVHEQRSRGYDLIKVYHGLTRESYAAVLAEAGALGLPVAGHVPEAVGLREALGSGQGAIEHLTGYAEALQRPDSPYRGEQGRGREAFLRCIDFVDEAGIPALVAATRGARVWNCPTLVTYRDWGSTPAEAAARLAQPEMKFVHPLLRAAWSPGNEAQAAYSDTLETADEQALMRRRYRLHARLTRALAEAGAGLLLGTDAGTPYVIPGVSAIEELELMVKAGLTPYQALVTGTRAPAEFVARESVFGTVAIGRRADLILLEGNPLEDVSQLRRRVGVMLRGHWLPAAELQERLASWSARLAPPADWFAGRARLAQPVGATYAARYRLSSFGIARGEERLVVAARGAGRLRIEAQLSTVEPQEFFSTRIDHADGRDTVAIASAGREGRGQVRWRLRGDGLSVWANLPVVGRMAERREAAAGTLLGAPGVAGYLALLPRLRNLEAGQTLVVPVIAWDHVTAFAPRRQTWTIKRQAEAPQAGARDPTWIYEIAPEAGFPLPSSRLELDERGWPRRLEVRLGEGWVLYERLDGGPGL